MKQSILHTYAMAILILGGCAVVESDIYPYNTDDTEIPTGFTYFLPRVMMKIEASRTTVTPASVTSKAQNVAKLTAAATAALSATNKAAAARKAKLGVYETAKADPNFDAAALAALKKDYEKAIPEYFKKKAASDYAKSLADAAQADLITYQNNLGTCIRTVTLKRLPIEADTANHYVAKLAHKWTRSDDLNIKSNDLGLLESTDLTSEDKLGEIAVSIAKLVLRAQRLNNLTENDKQALRTKGFTDKCKIYKAEWIFDPADIAVPPLSAMVLSTITGTMTGTMTGTITGTKTGTMTGTITGTGTMTGTKALIDHLLSKIKANLIITAHISHKPTADKKADGIYYRRPIPYQFDVLIDSDLVQSSRETLPNQGPIAIASLRAGAFVKTTRNLKFINGMLISDHAIRPSEGVGLMKIPAGILDAITSPE